MPNYPNPKSVCGYGSTPYDAIGPGIFTAKLGSGGFAALGPVAVGL